MVTMNFESVMQAHKEQYGRNYLICENEQERNFLLQVLAPYYAAYSYYELDLALGYACRTAIDKCNLKAVLQTMHSIIGKV